MGEHEESGKGRERKRESEKEQIEPLLYKDLIINGLRYFSDSIKELERMTLVAFYMMFTAFRLKEIDKKRDFIENELLKRKLKETETKGKKTYYVINDIKDIFDYEKAEKKVLGEETEDDNTFDRLRNIAINVRNYEKKGGK
ncbi:hypothetical protein [Anaerococcus vaginalis]|uniref:hypothetical protein n=1 Tax=Anaerococcus vaginalis TaxID=33037 RepID=UPI00290C8BE7|nr:hypothetical protein [Anaerococcus vaginalis]MDU5252703.1 hypothetical protein [Anaerococcus vaginalis]MDU6781460.1 hypothetical protein [Anaerococcus vaginalis]